MCTTPVLAAPCLQKLFKLQVDTSHMGAGAVPIQSDDQGVDRSVSFFSKKLNKHQFNYSVTEKETLAFVLALQH